MIIAGGVDCGSNREVLVNPNTPQVQPQFSLEAAPWWGIPLLVHRVIVGHHKSSLLQWEWEMNQSIQLAKNAQWLLRLI